MTIIDPHSFPHKLLDCGLEQMCICFIASNVENLCRAYQLFPRVKKHNIGSVPVDAQLQALQSRFLPLFSQDPAACH